MYAEFGGSWDNQIKKNIYIEKFDVLSVKYYIDLKMQCNLF